MAQHRFRHMMATRTAHQDMRSAMDQRDCDDDRSLMAPSMTCRNTAARLSLNPIIQARF